MNWHEYVNETGKIPEWPYEVNYGKENVIETDVLIVGGGVAGCRAAIAARQRGATVAVADRGFSKRSGAGGAGVDHWHGAVKNPCSKVTPRMYSEAAMETTEGFTTGLVRYIVGQEGWDTLLEAESWGLQIRDEEDEFKGSFFRDDETKLMFAYDIVNKHCLRIYGYNIKPVVDKEMRRIGCDVYDRICITSLLTEGGKKGARVIGATGINDRTGEFYIFKAKAVVVSTGGSGRIWGFAPELTESQSMMNLNQTMMGHTIGWKAGAELVLMEMFGPAILSGMGYAPYSTGNSNNTYQGSPVTDKDGNMVYYENAAGKVVTEEQDIFKPSEEDSFIIGWGIALNHEQLPKYKLALMETDVPEKLKSGEYKQPFYTDLTRLGPNSRDIMWRLMLAHEGKCRVPIYEQFTKWGFDPAKHMLQYPVADYSQFMSFETAWAGAQHTPHNWKGSSGGLTVDWRLQTTLPGLFAAGDGPIASQGCHGESHTAGRYAGRQAAVFAKKNEAVEADADQIAKAKSRVYAPIEAKGDIGWKELNYAVSRLMDDHCSDYLTEHTLDMGIRRIKDLLNVEGERMYANNPHELVRAFESYSIGELAIAVMEGAKARKASNHILGFFRDDYKEEPEEWHKFVGISKNDDDTVDVRLFPTDYHLQGEYSSDLEENYQRYAELED